MADRELPKGLGRAPSSPNPKRAAYRSAAALTSERNARTWITPVPMDQGETSQCVGYAGVHLLMSAPVINAGQDPSDLYEACKRVDYWAGEDYEGTSVDALGQVLRAEGSISRYEWATHVDQIVQHLLEVGPVVMGTRWDYNMFYPDAFGFIHPGGGMAGGHAYLLSNVNREAGHVRITNSWGPSWGQGGRGWLYLNDLADLLADQGEALLVTEQRER